MLARNIEQFLKDAVEDTPVLLVNGARQSGKSTLVKMLFKETHQYLTLDDPTTLAAIKNDPLSFLEQLEKPSIIDEIQRAPELFVSIKKVVDENRRPGFFVLTGSANVLTLPKLSESLAGRMEIHTLWPFSQGEILGVKETFIDKAFSETFKPVHKSIEIEELAEMIIKGGYPDAIIRNNQERRDAWFKSYLMTLLERDIRDLSNIEGLTQIPNLLNVLAARTSSLLNANEISRSMSMPGTTLKRYLTLLQMIFILTSIPAWSKNAAKRFIKSPKIYLNDTGLLMNVLFCDKERLLSQRTLFGHVLENFVVMEILKQKTWCKTPFRPYHYRTTSGQEVDIVLEASNSKIVGIEVKLSQSVNEHDFKGLRFLEESAGENFHRGFVLYLGKNTVAFGDNKYAVPISALWNM